MKKVLYQLFDHCYVLVDIQQFLQFVTGSSYTIRSITVTFSSDSEAILANTCASQLILPTCINSKKRFIESIKAVIPNITFTMP